MDLSVIIPARNEIFLRRTIEDVLANARAETEVIAIADGYDPGELPVHPRLRVICNQTAIGQRAATNQGARAARGKYIMKLDAHCSVQAGFDVALLQDCQDDWTMIPAMYNLHAFDWQCLDCQVRTYQGAKPESCALCGGERHEMVLVWRPRWNRRTVLWYFDRQLHFQYWNSWRCRACGDIIVRGVRPVSCELCGGQDFKSSTRYAYDQHPPLIDTMSFLGACMFLRRDRYWQLGGMDEAHGSWGQFGTEWACKTWLSGGRLVTSRRTWFAHLFRTSNFARRGESAWPYPMSHAEIEAARRYSRDLWLHDRWPLATRPLSWLLDRFRPIPDWHESLRSAAA